jgi:hypothetical protein
MLRRRCAEYLAVLLEKDYPGLKQQLSVCGMEAIEEAVKRGLTDGAPDVRLQARRAFSAFQLHWRERACS